MATKRVSRICLSCAVLLCPLGSLCFADVVAQLQQAETLTEAGQYQQAEQIYQQVAADYPGTDYAFAAQKGLAILYIKTNEDEKAQAAFDNLIAEFSWHKGIAEAIWQIAKGYEDQKKYDKAFYLYQYNVEYFPNDIWTMWSQVRIVYSHIRDGNDTAADAAFDKLLAVSSGQSSLPAGVYYITRRYDDSKKYDKGFQLQQYNVEHFPADIHAMWSQAEIVKYHIRGGHDAAADAAFEKLVGLFSLSEQATLPKEIYHVARRFSKVGDTQKALYLHQYNVNRFPNDIHGMWSQTEIIFSYIREGDFAAADAAFNELLTIFSAQPTLSKEVYKIANRFGEAGGNNEKAHQLYQYLIDTWSPAKTDIHARKLVVMSYISLGLDAEAQSAIQTLSNDFKDHPDLPAVLWQAAEADYDLAFRCESQGLDAKAKEYFLKVISTGQAILDQWPDSAPGAEICYISAMCHERLDEYAKAVGYYQKVVENWPDYEYAWNAQFLIARNYERLLDREGTVDPHIVAQIKSACEQVLQKYPDCPAAGAARDWLQSNTDLTDLIEGGQK